MITNEANEVVCYPDSERNDLEKKKRNLQYLKRKKIVLSILISLIGALVIGGSIGLVLYFKNKKEPEIKVKNSDEIIIPPKPKLKKEFEIVTNIKELKCISVVQRILEETKTNNNTISTEILRKTKYHIYFRSKEEADEENQLFYSTMYNAAISIVSECLTTDGNDCEPKKFVDLTSNKRSNSNNTRVLNTVEDFKDIPIALCLFNITDNNFITSMTCPESLSETKKNEIILDLYFFRPPAIQRADKENDNITITINDDEANNKRYIREINGGLCNIYNSFDSKCTTEMNTTTDLKGNLLSYDELAITSIDTDESNSFYRKKLTNLIDISEKTENLKPEKYLESLDKLLPFLNPYMKEDIHFTTDNFTDLYNLVQEKSKSSKKYYLPKKKAYRNLMEYAGSFVTEESLFNYKDVGGIEINYNLKADSGINSLSMKSFANLDFDDEKKYSISSLEEMSDLQKILDEIIELSKAGNHLATNLYVQIKDKLEGITNEISQGINSLNNLLKYYDLTDVFDSSLLLDSVNKLPITILEESNRLVNKLKQIYDGVKSGSMKNNVDNLSDKIYNYIKQTHKLIKNIFDNLKELGSALSSENNKITEVTTYYLNHTSSSYINIIQEVENILNNYYKTEYDIIYPKIENMLKEFEDNFIENLKKEKNIVNNLYSKINKTVTIEFANDEDYKTIILNLYNADKYITDIINKIKEYFNEKIGIKDSGYFTSNYDINENKKLFSSVLVEAKEDALKLDKDEYIDKNFDEIMIKFREIYINIIKYMEKAKIEQFPLSENNLDTSLFKTSDKNKIETNMTTFRVQISKNIKDENEYYIDNIKNYLSKFIADNKNELDNLISDLDILFSEESLKKLSNSFEIAFNSCLKTINDNITQNYLTAKNYFDNLANMINDNNFLIEKLKGYKVNEIPSYIRPIIFKKYKRFFDTITSKEKTSGYISKYNEFIANFDYSKKYLANQLYSDIVNVYKKVLTQTREILQTIKNNKITEKYPDFPELDFYNNHIKTIDKLYNRFNKYFSDDLFNNKFITPLNNKKEENNKYIDSIKTYVNGKHNSINTLSKFNDMKNDFCLTYQRTICYGCTNCAWRTYRNDRLCLPIPTYSNNYLNLIKSTIQSDSNLAKFNKEFNELLAKISHQVNNYNNRFKYMEDNFMKIKQDTLNQNFTLNYLQSISNSVNSILSEKYGEKIIKASYDYYQQLINERLQIILDNTTNKWENAYDELISDIESNYDNFKNSFYEYGLMASIYEKVISENITRNYFDSIVLFQKTEFNYTISYYYNYYLKIIKEAYQYILSKIPKNENGFNDIINKRKKEIDESFKTFINLVTNSLNQALSIDEQINILNVPVTNFFKINSILSNNIYATSQSLKSKIVDMEDYIGEEGDEISLVSRFYLENKENGKQIETFYDPVNHEIFVELNLEKFKDILIDNWIFDQDDFINRLNQTLYETTKEIRNEVSTKKEEYSNILENEISKYFQDDSIENIISNFYLEQIKDLNDTQINNINAIIDQIINIFKDIIINETTRMETTLTSYNSDFSSINNTINYYKTYIFNEINDTIFNVLEGFYENIYKNIFTNCMESKLNEYMVEERKTTSLYYNEKILYNSTYNVGEIIDNLLDDIIKNYKEITKKKIISKYNEYYLKIKSSVNIDKIHNLINNEIDNIYNSTLLQALKKEAKYTPGDEQYSNYDLSDEYKKEINKTILQKKNDINNIIISTKGANYNAEFRKCIDFDFSRVDEIIKPICDKFTRHLSSEKEEQSNIINSMIQSIIKSNFDDLLNNIIPTFGNQFFERIIKYNENFKIKSLYDNLKYSLSQTLLYYISLYLFKDIDEIPQDLKIRLYNLNNLDLTVENKNKKVLELLNKKINEFVRESKITMMEKYMSYLQEDVSIKSAFNKIIKDKIDDNLIKMQPEMEKNYQEILDKFLKERLINSYSKVMNDKTREMVMLIKDQKEVLKSKIDDLFSLDSDKVLREINTKINNTLDAINEYNNYKDTFIISNDLINYLDNYAGSSVKPSFEIFKNELNKATKDKLITNINTTSQQIEKLSPVNFISQSDNIYKICDDNYIKNISHSIELYGLDDYSQNLDLERTKKKETLRRFLSGEQTDNEIAEESKERIENEEIEEIFQKILNISNSTRNYFDSLKGFSDFDKKINNYKNNLNLAYKTSKEQIIKNEYEEEIDTYLNSKLNNLTNNLNNYYDKINESYYKLRNFLNKSLSDIDNTLNKCKDITYKTHNYEYEKIINKTNSTNQKYNSTKNNLNTYKYTKKADHKTNSAEVELSDFREYSEFKFDLQFEGTEIKKPKAIANIKNKSRPKTATIKVSSPFGHCGEIINELDVKFNEADYTMNIESQSNNKINVTTIINFAKYSYSTQVYEIGESNETVSADAMGLELNYNTKCKKEKNKILKNTIETQIDEQKISRTSIIQG